MQRTSLTAFTVPGSASNAVAVPEAGAQGGQPQSTPAPDSLPISSPAPRRHEPVRREFRLYIQNQRDEQASNGSTHGGTLSAPYRNETLGFSIEPGEDGLHLKTKPPPLARLVFSGGGAKGAAYAGAIHALEGPDESGALSGVKALYGSSAGAMTATLLASGMTATEFEKLTSNMNFLELIAKERAARPAPPNASAVLAEAAHQPEPGKGRGKIWNNTIGSLDTLTAIYRNRGTDAPALEQLIRSETRLAVLRRIKQAGNPPDVEAIRQRLQDENSDVTFGDLKLLQAHVPGIRELHCTGTAVIEDKPQTVVFSAEYTPEMPVAKAACISGAFPGVFAKIPYEMPHNRRPEAADAPDTEPADDAPGPSDALEQAKDIGEQTMFMDGGVLMNTPIPALIDGPHTKDVLAFVFEYDAVNNVMADKPPYAKPPVAGFEDKAAGAPVAAADNFLLTQVGKKFKDDVVKVPLRFDGRDYTGMVGGTLNFKMSTEEKHRLQEQLRKATDLYLEKRAQRWDEAAAGTLEQVLLALEPEKLHALHAQVEAGDDGIPAELARAAAAVFQFRQQLDLQLSDLAAHTDPQAGRDRFTLDDTLGAQLQWMHAQTGGNEDYLAFAAQALAASPSPGIRRMLEQKDDVASEQASTLLGLARQSLREQQVQGIALNMIRSFVYPESSRIKHTDADIKAFATLEAGLEKARTPSQFNKAINVFSNSYRGKRSTLERVIGRRTDADANPVPVGQLRKFRARLLEPDEKGVQDTARTIRSLIVGPVLHQRQARQAEEESDQTVLALAAAADRLEKLKKFGELETTLAALETLDEGIKARLAPYRGRLRDIAVDSTLREAQTYRLQES